MDIIPNKKLSYVKGHISIYIIVQCIFIEIVFITYLFQLHLNSNKQANKYMFKYTLVNSF